jgi:hypothetical protein
MRPEIQAVLERFKGGLGDSLGRTGSALLYGSAARDEYVAGRSDLNILLVADSLGPASLARLRTAIDHLRGSSRVPPLLFTPAEWKKSADVFPIELVDMQSSRVVLAGADPVVDVGVAPGDLRRALERELRGRLLHLRQAFVALGERPADLGSAMVASVAVVGVLLRASLVLAGEPATRATPDVISRAASRIGFPPGAVESIWRARPEKTPSISAEQAEQYLAAIEQAVQFIDHFPGGGTSS